MAFQFAGLEDPALDAFVARATDAGLALVNVAVDVGDLVRTDADGLAADVAELKRWIARVADSASVSCGSTPALRPVRTTETYLPHAWLMH